MAGEDQELGRVTCGPRGFLYVRSAEGEFCFCVVKFGANGKLFDVLGTTTVYRSNLHTLERETANACRAFLEGDMR